MRSARGGRLRNTLTRNVQVIGAKAVAQVVHRLLDRHDLRQDAIDWWVVHPGRTQVLNAVGRQVGLVPEKLRFSHKVFRHYGNMSSPSVMFVLDRILREAKPRPGQATRACSYPLAPVSPPLARWFSSVEQANSERCTSI
jgi:predicted naringenin-chalcone synthase